MSRATNSYASAALPVGDGAAPRGHLRTASQPLTAGQPCPKAHRMYADGSLSHRRVWAETGSDHPDGICWDADVGNKRGVRLHEGGKVLQTIELDRGGFACMLGGVDDKTLYIVATEWKGAGQRPMGRALARSSPTPHAGRP
ncbi:MAG TPA: hypothetical protein VJ761_21945 [Ktedonobacteraceae bacterium]|nr:hypothetical protein [Ktedonobacteraceae bacterium]